MNAEKVVPGTKHYEERIARMSEGVDVADVARRLAAVKEQTGQSIVLAYETAPLPNVPNCPHARIDHAVDYYGADAKLIYHVCDVSPNAMERLGRHSAHHILPIIHQLTGNVYADASQNPEFKSNWDLLIWGVAALRAAELRQHFLQQLLATFPAPGA